MKTLSFALSFCAFAATGCIIENHPANSTPAATPSSTAAPAPTTTAAPPPATTTTAAPTATAGSPPALREAPKQ